MFALTTRPRPVWHCPAVCQQTSCWTPAIITRPLLVGPYVVPTSLPASPTPYRLDWLHTDRHRIRPMVNVSLSLWLHVKQKETLKRFANVLHFIFYVTTTRTFLKVFYSTHSHFYLYGKGAGVGTTDPPKFCAVGKFCSCRKIFVQK